MRLLPDFKKNKTIDMTVLDMVVEVFDFLCTDLGFEIKETFAHFNNLKRDVVIYQNWKTNIQINISTDYKDETSNRFRIEVLKMYYGTSVCYSDYDNCFDYLIFLKLDNSQEESYYWGYDCNQIELFQRAADLISKHKTFFTTEEWRDKCLFDQLKIYSTKFNYNFEPSWKFSLQPYKQLFIDGIKELCKEYNFIMVYNSFEVPSYTKEDWYDRLEFKKLKDIISIRQHDVRDGQGERYSLYKNNKWLISFDIISTESTKRALLAIEHIIE